jgi:hypothetical protein
MKHFVVVGALCARFKLYQTILEDVPITSLFEALCLKFLGL